MVTAAIERVKAIVTTAPRNGVQEAVLPGLIARTSLAILGTLHRIDRSA
jgi:hypothetical protein